MGEVTLNKIYNENCLETMKRMPDKLAAEHIYSWSNEGDLVYDPFIGSGTTAKMAHLQKRNWIGSEISSEYAALAQKRIQPYLDQQEIMFEKIAS